MAKTNIPKVVIYLGWKIVKRSPFIKPEDMDFQTGLAEVEAHERTLSYKPPMTRYDRFVSPFEYLPNQSLTSDQAYGLGLVIRPIAMCWGVRHFYTSLKCE